ncbi:MAG: cytochrome c oxidase subunit II [Thermaerobacterales bacterium]
MDIDRYERAWIYISAGTLFVLLMTLLYSVYFLGINLDAEAGVVDPATVTTQPPFDEPGVFETAPGHYRVVMIARTWSFEPQEVRVPAGSTVTFLVTSLDVIHGLRVPHTTINRMIIPGQAAQVTHRFDDPGEFALFCHEYCGIGHHRMDGRVIVEQAVAEE